MRSLFFLFALIGCSPLAPYKTLECAWLHANYTGAELEGMLTEYEWALTEPPTITLEFEHYHAENPWEQHGERQAAEISVFAQDFTVLSSEIADDGWTDLRGNPLENVTFELNIRQAENVDKSLKTYFDDSGQMSLIADDNVWLYILWPPGANYISTTVWITGSGWEQDFGSCSLVR